MEEARLSEEADARSEESFAKAERARELSHYTANLQTPSPQRVALLDDMVRIPTEARVKAQENTQAATATRNQRSLVSGDMVRYINQDHALTEGPTLDDEVAFALKHQSARRAVAGVQAEHPPVLRRLARFETAQRGIEPEFAAFGVDLDNRASVDDYTFSRSRGKWNISFPTVAVHAEAVGGLPVAPDYTPRFIRDHRDEILAAAREEIEAWYATNDVLSMTVEEQREKIAEARAEFLALDRLEAAIIWAARAEGDIVEFRTDLDVRAILKVTGPPLKK
jgi:hypothetical protein